MLMAPIQRVGLNGEPSSPVCCSEMERGGIGMCCVILLIVVLGVGNAVGVVGGHSPVQPGHKGFLGYIAGSKAQAHLTVNRTLAPRGLEQGRRGTIGGTSRIGGVGVSDCGEKQKQEKRTLGWHRAAGLEFQGRPSALSEPAVDSTARPRSSLRRRAEGGIYCGWVGPLDQTSDQGAGPPGSTSRGSSSAAWREYSFSSCELLDRKRSDPART